MEKETPTPSKDSAISVEQAMEFLGTFATRIEPDHVSPVAGREEEIDRILSILSRKGKPNVALVGEAGVGKTTIVEGVAAALARGDGHPALHGASIWQVHLSHLLAGTGVVGSMEERVKGMLLAAAHARAILFFDEMHAVLSSTPRHPAPIADLLKPAMARGEVQIIGATTTEEYRRHILPDPALSRRFTAVHVRPMQGHAAVVQVLHLLREAYERYHGVSIPEDLLPMIVTLSDRYIPARSFPEKAIDLMDMAAAIAARAQRYGQESETLAQSGDFEHALRVQLAMIDRLETSPPLVRLDHVYKAVATLTNIPVEQVTVNTGNRMALIEQGIRRQVVGQDAAVDQVIGALRRAGAGIRTNPARPIGVFLFVGPSGVGKTSLASAIAEHWFGGSDAMVRVDMTMFGSEHTVSMLTGAPPGYVGYGDATPFDAIRFNPHGVVLLDEIEKAAPQVLTALMQAFDEGTMPTANGPVSLRHAIVIMTSNAGMDSHIPRRMGLAPSGGERQTLQDASLQALHAFFRPEMMNRIDAIVHFAPLEHAHLVEIVRGRSQRLIDLLQEQGVTLHIDESVYDAIARDALQHPMYGARPALRAFEQSIEAPVAQWLIVHADAPQKRLTVDVGPDGAIRVGPTQETPQSVMRAAYGARGRTR
ncbi:MAG: AAA family ATPase [Minisyncoccia bacterium]